MRRVRTERAGAPPQPHARAAAGDPRRHRGGFTVLTGSSETQRLVARGTVAESFRGDYDVLARPRGSRSEIERRTGQAPPNFLSELSEGITNSQWRRIQRLPGVEVAAPIANLGYVFPTARVPVDISAAAGTQGRVLLRARIAWRSEGGLTRAGDRPNYAYVTSNRLRNEPGWRREEVPVYGASRCARICPAGGVRRRCATRSGCSSPKPSSRARSPRAGARTSAASRAAPAAGASTAVWLRRTPTVALLAGE